MLNDYEETPEQSQDRFKRSIAAVLDDLASRELWEMAVAHARGVSSMMHAARIVEPYNAEAALSQVTASIQHLSNLAYWASTAAKQMQGLIEKERQKPSKS